MSNKKTRNEDHVPARIRQANQSLPIVRPPRPGIVLKRAVKIALIEAELERRYIGRASDESDKPLGR